MGTPKPHVAIFPGAGMGHLIPAAELAMRLSGRHGLSVTFITCKWMFSPHLMSVYSDTMASSGLDITFIQLPEVEIEGAKHMKPETLISKLLEKSKGSVENALRSLVLHSACPISCFITDFFCSTMLDVATELGIPTYVFFTSTASLLSLMLSIPKLVSEIPISFKDADFPIEVPGVPPISGRDLPSPLQDRSDEAFYWFVHHSSRLWEVTGILLNTFEELELSQLLPKGFESRTRDRGLVVASWAPQIPVLSHPSTGGFLSHCGWNSTLESLLHGVPMICWPLFAEQRMNKILLVNEFKMAIATKMESDEFVRSGEVERAVRELMEGEGGTRVRARARELKEMAISALKEGGSSYKAMAAAVSEWTTNAQNSAANT